MNNTDILKFSAVKDLFILNEITKRAASFNRTMPPPPSANGMTVGWTPHGGLSFMGLPFGAVPANQGGAQPQATPPAQSPAMPGSGGFQGRPPPFAGMVNPPPPQQQAAPMDPLNTGPTPSYPGAPTHPANTGANKPAPTSTVVNTTPQVFRPAASPAKK